MAETLTIRTASSTEVVKIAVPGPQGPAGQGVPTGGSTGQVLRKVSGTDYDTEWAAAGSGSGSVTSVAISGSDGIEIDSGSPITSSGTIALGINAATLRSHLNVADGATANSSDATLLNRANHTGTQAASTISDFTSAAAAAAPVQSVAGRTGAVTLAVADVTNAVATSDARLTDSRTPTAHAASHGAGGSDPITPASISAMYALETRTNDFYSTSNYALAQGRNVQLNSSVFSQSTTATITLPRLTTDSAQNGDDLVIVVGAVAANSSAVIERYIWTGSSYISSKETIVTTTAAGSWRFRLLSGVWTLLPVMTHTHAAADITSGTLDIARIPTGTGSTQVALGNHTHTQLHDKSHTMTDATSHTAGTHKVFYSDGSGNIQELALGATGTVLTSGGTATAPSFAAASGGVTGAASSASDVLGVSGANITGVDANADRIVFWDDSASKLAYLEAGSGLSISGTTLTATATGTIGGSTGSTDNAILRADGTGGSTSQSSDISILDATTSTQNNVAITNEHSGQTNSALVLTPKGTGAFIIGPRPNGAATGGNARGTNAVDLQTDRTAATDVASGTSSVICGGRRNSTGSAYSVICGGNANSMNATSGSAFIGGGQENVVNGANYGTIAGGIQNSAAASCFIGGGNNNFATAIYASVLGGIQGLADRYSLQSHASGQFAARGDAQRIRAVMRNKTTTNSAVELFLDGSATRLTCPSGKVIAMLVNITGVKSDGSAVAHYVRQYAIKNVGGTTSEVYAAVTVGTDNAASTSIALSANDTNDALKIEVTGIASETWRWVASVDAVEVAYGT